MKFLGYEGSIAGSVPFFEIETSEELANFFTFNPSADIWVDHGILYLENETAFFKFQYTSNLEVTFPDVKFLDAFLCKRQEGEVISTWEIEDFLCYSIDPKGAEVSFLAQVRFPE